MRVKMPNSKYKIVYTPGKEYEYSVLRCGTEDVTSKVNTNVFSDAVYELIAKEERIAELTIRLFLSEEGEEFTKEILKATGTSSIDELILKVKEEFINDVNRDKDSDILNDYVSPSDELDIVLNQNTQSREDIINFFRIICKTQSIRRIK